MRPTSSRHAVTSAALLLTLASRPLLAFPDSTRVALPAADSTAAATAAGPRASTATAGARVYRPDQTRAKADASAAVAPERQHHGSMVALMVVGASAIVLGLIVGDDAETPLVVGGAVVGLIGLYQYLR